MPAPILLLVAPPSEEREQFAHTFVRHGTRTLTCDDCRTAKELLETVAVHSVFVMHLMQDPELGSFLLQIRARHPGVPVLFSGEWDPYRLVQLVGQHMVMLLPPGVSPSTLEHFFFPETEVEPETALTLRKAYYSLNYKQARLEFEAEYLARALERERGNVTRTARVIGMARRLLQLKIQMYRINLDMMRNEEDSGLNPV
jgi:DNA-binding NtrC family response regulator